MVDSSRETSAMSVSLTQAVGNLPGEFIAEFLGSVNAIHDALWYYENPERMSWHPSSRGTKVQELLVGVDGEMQVWESERLVEGRRGEPERQLRGRQPTPQDPDDGRVTLADVDIRLGSFTSARYTRRPNVPELSVANLRYGSPLCAVFEGTSGLVDSMVALYHSLQPVVAPHIAPALNRVENLGIGVLGSLIAERLTRNWGDKDLGGLRTGDFSVHAQKKPKRNSVPAPSGSNQEIEAAADSIPPDVLSKAGPAATVVTVSTIFKLGPQGLEFQREKTTKKY